MNIVILDTETTSLEKPFAYNIGYVIYNTDTGKILKQCDFVVEQVWHNTMLFTTAYYASKRDLYVARMRARACVMDKFGYITQQMYRDFKEYEVQHGFAYNSPFDVGVFAFNCDWFKCYNPLDTIQMHDIRGQVHRKIAFTQAYQDFCETHKLFSESGNYSTSAETAYRFVKQNVEFIEEHTALADSIIELEILVKCVGEECDWTTDYTVYRSIPRIVPKEYIVIDREGTEHKFQYTCKRKISGRDGVRLSYRTQNNGED